MFLGYAVSLPLAFAGGFVACLFSGLTLVGLVAAWKKIRARIETAISADLAALRADFTKAEARLVALERGAVIGVASAVKSEADKAARAAESLAASVEASASK